MDAGKTSSAKAPTDPADRSQTDTWLALLSLTVAGLLLYAPSFFVPWYFDDFPVIVDQAGIRDLGLALGRSLAPRGIADLTFALNYHFGGIGPWGFHAVNLAIHIGSAWLVFLLARRIWDGHRWLPWLTALLFLGHPLQTQAVTYVVQRYTCLSGFFLLLALLLHLQGREALNRGEALLSGAHLRPYLAALVCGALAVLTKQNAAILPLALLLFSGYFQPEPRWRLGRRVLYVAPFLLAPLLLGCYQLILPALQGVPLTAISATSRLAGSGAVTPAHYLATEWTVLWIYLKLLWLPLHQALDYSYPVVQQIVTGKNLLALFGLVALGGMAWWLRHRLPTVSFGLAWFFLTLAIESTVLPLDPLFEHRLYLPMFGFVVALIGLLRRLVPSPRGLIGLLCLLFVGYGGLTVMRNRLWTDPVAFYQDNLRQAPRSERVSVALGKAYLDAGRLDEAEAVLQGALTINPRYDLAYLNLSNIYIQKHRYPEALAVLNRGLALDPKSAHLFDNLGTLYDLLGQTEKAEAALAEAIRLDPNYPKPYVNLGVVQAGQREWASAIGYYRQAIRIFPEYAAAHYNLGVAYYRQQNLPAALAEFTLASRLKPGDAKAHYNQASVALELGQMGTVRAILPTLERLDSRLAGQLREEIGKSQPLP